MLINDPKLGLVRGWNGLRKAIGSKANVHQPRNNGRLKSAASAKWNIRLRKMIESNG